MVAAAAARRRKRVSDINMLIENGLILQGESGALWTGTLRPDVDIM